MNWDVQAHTRGRTQTRPATVKNLSSGRRRRRRRNGLSGCGGRVTDGRAERFCSARWWILLGRCAGSRAARAAASSRGRKEPGGEGHSGSELRSFCLSLSTPAGLGAPAAAAETIPLAQGRRLEVGDASSLKGRAPWRLSIGTLVNPLWLSGWDGAGTIWRWWVRIF